MAVRKEKNKNTWYVQTSFVNYMGERKRTTKRGFRTKRTALEWEEEFKRSNSGCKDMTLNSLYERYKEDNATKIRITTWDNKNSERMAPYSKGIQTGSENRSISSADRLL